MLGFARRETGMKRNIDFSDEEEECEDAYNYDYTKSNYASDIKKQAQEALLKFFQGKKFWAGAKLDLVTILNDRIVTIVLETSVIDAVDLAYRSLAQTQPDGWDVDQEKWDIKLINSITQEFRDKRIPKNVRGGIMLVYLEYCYGVETLRRLERFNYHKKRVLAELLQKQAVS
jgi:hypothetical protein